MNPKCLLVALAWVPLCAFGQPRLPPDVVRFVERRDQCDHFRGEEAYDAERRRFLAGRLQKFCTGTDTQLQRLKARYRKTQPVLDRLNVYEARIEG